MKIRILPDARNEEKIADIKHAPIIYEWHDECIRAGESLPVVTAYNI